MKSRLTEDQIALTRWARPRRNAGRGCWPAAEATESGLVDDRVRNRAGFTDILRVATK